MIHGEVVGELWSTVKVESLTGFKMLVVRPAGGPEKGGQPPVADVVSVDLVGAGLGDRVIVALGKGARNAVGRDDIACEAAIVGVVDEAEPPKKKRRKRAKKKPKPPAEETGELFPETES